MSLSKKRCGLKAMRTERSAPRHGYETPRTPRRPRARARHDARHCLTSSSPGRRLSRSVARQPGHPPGRPRHHDGTNSPGPHLDSRHRWSLPLLSCAQRTAGHQAHSSRYSMIVEHVKSGATLDAERRLTPLLAHPQVASECPAALAPPRRHTRCRTVSAARPRSALGAFDGGWLSARRGGLIGAPESATASSHNRNAYRNAQRQRRPASP
jgi:hypothetical protein